MKDKDGIGFRFPHEEKRALERIAEARDVSTATIVREALRWYMTVLATHNPTAAKEDEKEDAATETRGSPWATVG